MSEQPTGDAVSDAPSGPRSTDIDPTRSRGSRPGRVDSSANGSERRWTDRPPQIRRCHRDPTSMTSSWTGSPTRRPSGRRDGRALLHVAVVHAVSQELDIEIEDALEHPAVDLARELLRTDNGATADDSIAGADARRRPRPPTPAALLLDAVHVFGIETLKPGDEDIELRLADVGIDVRKPSTDETIGRLRWNEVRSIAVQRPRRGLPGRRRPALLVARTDRGEVTFELPGVSDEEINAQSSRCRPQLRGLLRLQRELIGRPDGRPGERT